MKRKMNSSARPTRAAQVTLCARERMVACSVAHSMLAHAETAHGGEILHALMFLQNRPRTSLELQLSTNTISPSLRTSHLTP